VLFNINLASIHVAEQKLKVVGVDILEVDHCVVGLGNGLGLGKNVLKELRTNREDKLVCLEKRSSS